ncbi:recombinase family protein [Motiliproteus sediminis]|uniref:recombinase family protein n=1 Tax=Motiliproteus sediminis TaxID=1468178 RepID=UPI001AEFB4B5|nr:recombinase family protein [Motiliproteus sediminis]
MKLYSYRRISSAVQKKGHGLSRQSDTELLQRLSAKYNLPISDEVFSDEGRSAYHGDHLENDLGRFLHAVEIGKVRKGSILVIESLDRLSRQAVNKAQELFLSIINRGVRIYTGIDDKLYDSEDQNLSASLIVSLIYFERANNESAHKSFRTKAAQKAAIKKYLSGERCIIPTGKNPSWVAVNEERNGFDLVPDKQRTLLRLSELYLEGKGMVAVVRQLAAEGYEPITKAHNTTVYQRLIRSPMLYGEKTYTIERHKYELPDYYPPVMDRETWLRMQHQRTKRVRQRGQTPDIKLLTGIGITKCGYCGSPIVSHGKNTLICRTKTRGTDHCVRGTVNQTALEDAILASVNDCKGLLFKPNNDELTVKRIKLVEELEQVKAKIKRLVKLVALLDDEIEDTAIELNKLQVQKNHLEADIENLEISDQKKNVTLEDWQPYLDSHHPDRQRLRELIQDTFESILVHCIGSWADIDTLDEMIEHQDFYQKKYVASVELIARTGERYGITLHKNNGGYEIGYVPKLTEKDRSEIDRLNQLHGVS